jgi:hypothetical protein
MFPNFLKSTQDRLLWGVDSPKQGALETVLRFSSKRPIFVAPKGNPANNLSAKKHTFVFQKRMKPISF